MDELLKEYANIKLDIEALEAKLTPLKNEILKHFIENNIPNIQNDYGKFSKSNRTTYVYPDEVTSEIESLKDTIKLLENKAKSEGLAQKIESVSLTYYKPTW